MELEMVFSVSGPERLHDLQTLPGKFIPDWNRIIAVRIRISSFHSALDRNTPLYFTQACFHFKSEDSKI